MKRCILLLVVAALVLACGGCSQTSSPAPMETVQVWEKPDSSTVYQYSAGWTPPADPEQTEEEAFILQQLIPMVYTQPEDFEEYMVFEDIDDFCETVFRSIRMSDHEISETSDNKVLLYFFPENGESQTFEFDKLEKNIVLSRVVISFDGNNYELTIDQQVRLMKVNEIGNRISDEL